MADVDINSIPIHGYAAAVLHMYKNKLVEINTGEIRTTHELDQFSYGIKHVIRGIVKDAVADAVVVESLGPHKKIVLINAWSICSVVEFNNKGSLKDVYYDEDKRLPG